MINLNFTVFCICFGLCGYLVMDCSGRPLDPQISIMHSCFGNCGANLFWIGGGGVQINSGSSVPVGGVSIQKES